MIVNATGRPKGKKETRCCIDLGSSYFRKLVVEVEPGGMRDAVVAPAKGVPGAGGGEEGIGGPRGGCADAVVRIADEREYIGWGEDLAASGAISRSSLRKAERILMRFSEGARPRGDAGLTTVATNVLRLATNRDEARAFLEAQTGLRIDVLSLKGEAFLGFAGATSILPRGRGAVLADPGGTSTELSWGRATEATGYLSIPVGTHTAGPPGGEASMRITAAIGEAFEESHVPTGDSYLPGTRQRPTIIFTGGSAVSLAVVWKWISGGFHDDAGPTVILAEQLEESIEWVDSCRMTGDWSGLPLPPERLRLLPQGLSIVKALVTALRAREITITTRDLRWGVVLGEGITERGYLYDEQESPDSGR